VGRKRPEPDDLAAALTAPAFETEVDADEASAIHQLLPTTLVLTLDQLKSYEHNPRRAENPQYDRLVDSIRARRGLTTPLTVTKRPGEDLYTIAAGGNSRLSVLRELYEATGDACFYRVSCRVEPWASECQVLAGHLIENDVRGNMTFGDKAQAIVHWQRLYEDAQPQSPALSQRALQEKLAKAGFQVSHQLVGRYLYTARHLLPVLPKAFESGLGRPSVEEIIRLRTFAEQYWDEVSLPEGFESQVSFEEVFSAACTVEDRHREDWDLGIFQSVLATQIAQALHLDPKIVVLDIDSLYHGIPVTELGNPAGPEPLEQAGWAFERAREELAQQAERARQRKAAREDRKGGHPDPAESTSDVIVVPPPESLPTVGAPSDFEAPRAAIYTLACRISEHYRLGKLVKPCDLGLGFYIDAPEPPDSSPQSVAFSGLRSRIWWWLCICAEQLHQAHLRAIGDRDPESWLFQLFEEFPRRVPGTDPLAGLYLLVGQPDCAGLSREFLASPELPDEHFAGLMALVNRCRALQQAAHHAGISVWDVSP